jgi:uncharacterized membrane protein
MKPDPFEPRAPALPAPNTGPAQPVSSAQAAHKPVFIGFLVSFVAIWTMLLLGLSLPPEANWPEALFVLCGTATSLVSLARRLPLQNVVGSAALIGGISAVIEGVGALTGIPFGPRVFTENLGGPAFGIIPWPTPLLWIIVIITSRGIARLIMRPWRKTSFYGFWVIGLTCLLATIFDLGFQPFATRSRHYWVWKTPEAVLNWYGTPWTNFLGRLVTSLFIMVFTSPFLINKNPVKQPTDYHPLVVWGLLTVLLATANAFNGAWAAVWVPLSFTAIITWHAIRGARW